MVETTDCSEDGLRVLAEGSLPGRLGLASCSLWVFSESRWPSPSPGQSSLVQGLNPKGALDYKGKYHFLFLKTRNLLSRVCVRFQEHSKQVPQSGD